jgi:peptidase E
MANPSKRILAIGGGGFLMEDAASPIDAHIVQLTGKPRPRICFIGTPSGDLPEHIDKFYAAFGAERCEPSHLAFFRQPRAGSAPLAALRDHLLAQDALYVGGGNTKSALGVWREWGADNVFAEAYAAGVLLAGVSAGAMCWFDAGLTDSYWGAGYQPLRCLGLLAGGCAVHYSSEPGRRTRLHEALAAGAVPATLAIDDHAAVLIEDGAAVRALSWAPGAGARRVDWVDGVVREAALAGLPLLEGG